MLLLALRCHVAMVYGRCKTVARPSKQDRAGHVYRPTDRACRVNSISRDELIKVVVLEGEEWLLYKSFPLTVALLRGTTADEKETSPLRRNASSWRICRWRRPLRPRAESS